MTSARSKLSVAVLLSLAGCARSSLVASERPALVVVAAGDIAPPSIGRQEDTAQLVEAIKPAAVLVAGDSQYGAGLPEEFALGYAPTWGRFKAITHPAPGNHEYKSGAAGYFAYFGASAGEPDKGYYSFELGDWHFVALNTGDLCQSVGCEEGSPQLAWLEADLAATKRECVLAFFHHPRWNSGHHGPFLRADALWKTLARHRVELVVNGHEHFYERMAPINGIVQFTVGTGGISFSDFSTPIPQSLVRQNDTFGVLKLELGASTWRAEFVPVRGATFTDHTSGRCR
ncbi:MAG: metallophosphoesterase family protein [Myxococcota bacterium]